MSYLLITKGVLSPLTPYIKYAHEGASASALEWQQREQIQQDLGEGSRHPVLLVQPVTEEERIAACSVARHVEQPNVGLPAAVVRSHLCGIQGPRWPASAAHAADWPRLGEARGSLRHDLALKAASEEPARQSLCHLAFDMRSHQLVHRVESDRKVRRRPVVRLAHCLLGILDQRHLVVVSSKRLVVGSRQ